MSVEIKALILITILFLAIGGLFYYLARQQADQECKLRYGPQSEGRIAPQWFRYCIEPSGELKGL